MQVGVIQGEAGLGWSEGLLGGGFEQIEDSVRELSCAKSLLDAFTIQEGCDLFPVPIIDEEISPSNNQR